MEEIYFAYMFVIPRQSWRDIVLALSVRPSVCSDILIIRNIDFTHYPDLWGWIERSDIEIVQIVVFCLFFKLSSKIYLAGFCYDLNDIQDELDKCGFTCFSKVTICWGI